MCDGHVTSPGGFWAESGVRFCAPPQRDLDILRLRSEIRAAFVPSRVTSGLGSAPGRCRGLFEDGGNSGGSLRRLRSLKSAVSLVQTGT